MPRIVLIDDDEHQSAFVQKALELKNFKVEFLEVPGRYSVLAEKLEDGTWSGTDLFILDVMMPHHPRYTSEATRGGLITGVLIARDIRDKFQNIPIILWSTAPFKDFSKPIQEFANDLPKCTFISKYEGADRIKEIYNNYMNGKGLGPSIQQISERGLLTTA